MDKRQENNEQPLCQSCGAAIHKENDIRNKWIKKGLFVLIAGVAVIVWGSNAVLSIVGGISMLLGTVAVTYGATGTFIEDEEVGTRWITTGLSVFAAGVAILVLVSEVVLALGGGIAITGGAIAVAYGVTGTFTNGFGSSNVKQCSNCDSTIQETENVTTTFDDTLETDKADMDASASEAEDSEPDYGVIDTADGNSNTTDISRPKADITYVPVFKCKRQEFKLGNENKVIPQTIGAFVSRFDRETFTELLNDVSMIDEWKPGSDSLLLIEKLDKKMEAVTVNIQMQDLHDWLASCDGTFIKDLEDKYQIVILSTDKEREVDPNCTIPQVDGPDDIAMDSYAFSRDDIQLETDLGEQGFMLYFSNNNITTFPADAIVNSCRPDLVFDGQLASQIAQEAGPGMVKECQDFIDKNGPLKTGEVFASKAGNLDFEYILHPASPTLYEHGDMFGPTKELGPNKYLVETAKNILAKADELDLRELALPAISAGGFGFSMEVSLLSIYTGINEYSKRRQGKCMLKDVTLVDKNLKLIQEVKNVMVKVFGDDKVLDKESVKQRNAKSVTCKIIGAKKEILEDIIKQLADKCKGVSSPVVKEPATWSPMVRGERYRLEMLSTNSVDFMQIDAMITHSIKGAKTLKIERIQYPDLYKGMMDFKHKTIVPDNQGIWKDEFEKKLWHGTSKDAAENIKKDTFRRKYISRGLFGKGTYLGSEPSVSHVYTFPDTSRHRYMFRCTVMVGKEVVFGKKGSNEDSTSAPPGYHTVVTSDGEYYVVFKENQVCPDYLITYTC